jgi:decaprenylphospho-beta-D-erythro-pentofuranosid-2-ulose 2-reductase
MKFKNIIIYGGTSQISISLIKLYLNDCEKFIVFCRNSEKFKKIFPNYFDLVDKIDIHESDLNDLDKNLNIIQNLENNISGIFWISGFTGDAKKEYDNIADAKKNINVNLVNPVLILNQLSKKIIKNKNSFIVALASVAGLKGRKKQLFYSTAKSGLISFLSGLRQKLFKYNVHVMTVIPGYMNTEPFKSGNWNAPRFLITEPNKVALIIKYSLKKKREIVYINFYWRIIMSIIKIIPEKIFKRFSF